MSKIEVVAHTPGPWKVNRSMRDCVTFVGRHGVENLFLENLDGYYACQNEADARLIAAAPDMLAALRRAVLALAFAAESSPAMRDDYEAVSAAIALATGSQS